MCRLTKNSNNLIQSEMEIIFKKPLWFTVITILCLVAITLFAAEGCDKAEVLPNYTVTFAGEGIGIEAQSITHGNYATAPENPQRESYDFEGWFTDNGTFINKWDFKANIVTQDTTLYAKWTESTLQDYPIEIPFTEYSLAGTSCQWRNFDYDYTNFNNGEILVINSNEQLENYINCTIGNYPEINFETSSLIIAFGVANNGIYNIEKQLIQIGNSQYNLNATIKLKYTEVLQEWLIVIIVDKLSNDTMVTLLTEITHI